MKRTQHPRATFNARRGLVAAIAMCLMGATFTLGSTTAAWATTPPAPFFNGFETDTSGWFTFSNGSVARVPSGYTNGGGYAEGVASATGGFFARLRVDPTNLGNPTCSPGSLDCVGPYTLWGTDGTGSVFPAGGYATQVAIYLDTSFGPTHPDFRFDWDSAINDTSGAPLQDYVFNAGTDARGFVIGTSTNALRGSTFPANPCPTPSAAPNTCRTPVEITTSGWYTFRHTFTDVGGFLDVEFTILNASGDVVPGADWTVHTGNAISGVGSTAFGWFPDQEIQDLAVDDSLLTGLTSGADLSVTQAGSPDPAHPGQKLTYTIPVTNHGPNTATRVTLSDMLPKSTGFGSVTTSQGTCARSKTHVSCNLGDLASGATATVIILVKPTDKGTITNTVAVTATSPSDPNTLNNTATATTTVKP